MTHTDEFQDIAGQLLDLWQQQLTASMKDPEIVSQTMQMFATLQRNFSHQPAQERDTATNAHEESSASTAPASTAYDNDAEFELRRCVSDLEKRTRYLESRVRSLLRFADKYKKQNKSIRRSYLKRIP